MNQEQFKNQNTDGPSAADSYAFLKENGINEDQYNALKKNIVEKYDLSPSEMIEFMLQIGRSAEELRETENAIKIYYMASVDAETLDYKIRKNLFVKCILKLSKLEYMRGISPAETLNLQRKAISMINQNNLTGEDALLLLYAGMGEHFGGELERGERLRTKGIKYLKEFNYQDLESEAIPLIVWHYYLSGNLKQTIGYYENFLIPIENKNDEEIIIMAYPSVIFSYFLMGEYSRALILCENIYKKALRLHDPIAANLMFAISGRIHVYMGDMENAENILYDSYAEAKELNYGWGLYYALFGICFYQFKKGNYEASREAMYLAREAAREHGFVPINASPFLLDVMKVIKENGLKPVDDFDYDTQINRYLGSNNVHLKGVAYRHIALQLKEKKDSFDAVKNSLLESVNLLEQSGNIGETYKSCVELARLFLEKHDEKNARIYANRSWNLLNKSEKINFPNNLIRLVHDEQNIVSFSNMLETTWLELRHVINEERMLTRLLTSMCRLLLAECGVFFTINNGKYGVRLAQNIEFDDDDKMQHKRIYHVVEKCALSGKLDINYKFSRQEQEKGENIHRLPKYSVCIPFTYEGVTFAAIYVESFYETEPLGKTEIDIIEDFRNKMAEPLYAVLNYETASAEAATIELESDEDAMSDSVSKNEQICASADSSVIDILNQIKTVAKTNIPVLITGETGVGKEVFAREVYENSNYKKTFIKVNCGAIPESLIESELFGYEKGSFTGATQRKKGYFELAKGGTIFLDEIGELSLLSQVKLLRVLQEHELMRVGGTETVKVDFRLVAATNKNLNAEVEKGHFRKDLFYRLNVVRLTIPPLRKRKKDIPVLANFFIKKYCRQFGKPMCMIDHDTSVRMLEYPWPGNVREMENILQKAVLFSKNNVVKIDFDKYAEPFSGEVQHDESVPGEVYIPGANTEDNAEVTEANRNFLTISDNFLSLADMERQYIETVVDYCDGKISGKGGAAEILGLKRTTLISKMNKLGMRNKEDK